MNKYVRENFSCKSFNKLITCACVEASKAEVGSSHKMKSGLVTTARAIPIR